VCVPGVVDAREAGEALCGAGERVRRSSSRWDACEREAEREEGSVREDLEPAEGAAPAPVRWIKPCARGSIG
jgi:hypothetical protein